MIIVVVTARPSYARCQTVLEALRADHQPYLVIATASAVLERYGNVAAHIRQDGHPVILIPSVLEGSSYETAVISVGNQVDALGRLLARASPRLVVTIADRRETLATAIAASYQHIPLMQLCAGERSGSIDDRVRAAVGALADYWAIPNDRLLVPYQSDKRMRVTGCASVDLALRARDAGPVILQELGGTGAPISLQHPFVVLLQHPVSGEAEASATQLAATVEALVQINRPVVSFWPGEETGSEQASKVYRLLKEQHQHKSWHFVRNVQPALFYRLLLQADCLVGNSSVAYREAAALGVRAVDIGTRQRRRYVVPTVVHCQKHEPEAIVQAYRDALTLPATPTTVYGDGTAGKQIAAWIGELCPR